MFTISGERFVFKNGSHYSCCALLFKNKAFAANCKQPMSSLRETLMPYKRYMCLLCGYIYDEEKGWPEDGIAPGTRWVDIPPAWHCPECGATKDDFEMIEI